MRPRSLFPAALAALAATSALPAQETPRPARELIAGALADAKGRTVLVAFHASWCGWCRRLEGVLAQPAVKEVMDRRFVTLWLTVQERGPKQVLDHPGAAELYAQWTGGAKAGIPFYLVLDAKGAPLATSIRPGSGNLGYPGSPDELKGFLALLKTGAPGLTAAEEAVLAAAFDAARPKS